MADKKKNEQKSKVINCYNCNAENESEKKPCVKCGADLTDNEEKASS